MVFRLIARQLYHRVILIDAAARDVARLGVFLAKGGQFAHKRQELWRIRARLDPTPCLARRGDIGVGAGQGLKLFLNPAGAARLFKLARKKFVDLAQVRDIGQRVFRLRIAQRAAGPIGKTGRLIKRLMGDLTHQSFISHLFAKATDHRRDLRVEQGFGKDARIDKENL